jgi:HD domain
MSQTIITEIPLLEKILGDYKAIIGKDFVGYSNHVYRAINCARNLNPHIGAEDFDKLVVAGAFHDIGIWTAGTLDYLPPSIEAACEYLEREQKKSWIAEVIDLIELHHKLRPIRGENQKLAEIFRKADLADFSLGFVRSDVDRKFIAELKVRLPNAGFHLMLIKAVGKRFLQHPLNMFPMMKW